MAYTVNLIAVPEQAIAYIRERGPISALAARVHRLRLALAEAGAEAAGPVMARYFEQKVEDGDIDYEVAVPILPRPDGSVPDRIGEARGDVIPAHHAFTTEHRGPHDQMHTGYTALTEELNAIGYAIAGPTTEVYLVGPDTTDDPARYVTELRIPSPARGAALIAR